MLLKIGMAIAVAMAAALIVVIAGLFADISTGTVLLRALFTFTVLGFGLVFGVFWAERYGIPFYMSKHKEKQSEWLKLYLMLKEMEKNGDGGEAGTENGTEQGPEESSLVDVKVTDEPEAAGLEPLTEEEMASLAGDAPQEEQTPGEGEPQTDREAAGEAAPAEEAEPAEEKPEFTPLAVDSMTRLTTQGESRGL